MCGPMSRHRRMTRLTRDVVAITKGSPADPNNRVAVHGSDDAAVLGTFNSLIEHLAERQRLEAQLVHMAHHDGVTTLPTGCSSVSRSSTSWLGRGAARTSPCCASISI